MQGGVQRGSLQKPGPALVLMCPSAGYPGPGALGPLTPAPWSDFPAPPPLSPPGGEEGEGRVRRQDEKPGLCLPGGSVVKNLPAVQERQEMRVQSLGQEDPLEEEMATRASILAWKISWTEEPGGLQSVESQGVGHD